MTSVAIRVDVGGEDYIPHTFLSVTHPNGSKTEYGLAPQNHSKESSYGIAGKGMIEVKTIPAGDMVHEYKYQSPVQQLNDTQYKKLMGYINQSIENPPNYILPGKWSGGGKNCTNWATGAWQSAGIPNTFGVTNPWVWNPYGQGLFMALSNLGASKFSTSGKQANYAVLMNDYDPSINIEGALIINGKNNDPVNLTPELFGEKTILTKTKNTTPNFIGFEDFDNGNNFNEDDGLYFNIPISKALSQEDINPTNEVEITLETINQTLDNSSDETTINFDDVLVAENETFIPENIDLPHIIHDFSDNVTIQTNTYNPVQEVKICDDELSAILKIEPQMLDEQSSSNKPLLLADILGVSESNLPNTSSFIPAIEHQLDHEVTSTIW